MRASETHAGGIPQERFARIRDLFGRACELDGADRATLLDVECAGDDELRTRVLELLAAEERATGISDPESGALIRHLLAQGVGRRLEEVGPYRIQSLIGRGGMGEVYLAEQSNPRRRVALKVLPIGSDSAVMTSWFGREVRILGRLEHPGIARIYEAGTTETVHGPVSYFAMEYIAGRRLLDYAREAGLGTRERVELIAAAAEALQHAHTKGVVHRDLKPANILVRELEGTGAGPGSAQPVILDFGVARALEPGAGPHTAIAEAGMLIGTIAYMSPEQLSGDHDAVDARADVYSLGVILYELLTGRLPHEVRGKPLAEAARLVHEGRPAALNAPGNAGGAEFDEDLEVITARAIEQDRARRYATSAAMCEDLRRYLRHEPVQARRATAAYQLRLFARRNRRLVVTAAAGVLALVGGLGASVTLYVREQQAHGRAESLYESEQAARRLADERDRLGAAIRGYMIEGLLMSAAPGRMGHEVKVLDVLAKAAEGLHDRFADHPDVEAGIRADLARVLGAVGKYSESDAQWALAIPLIEATSGADSGPAISALLGRAGVLHELRRRGEAIDLALEALARARRVEPAGVLVVRALNQIGASHEAEGRHRPALKHLREGLAIAEESPELHAAVIPSLMTYINSAEKKQGNREGALEMSRRIVAYSDEHMGAQSPTAILSRHNLIIELLESGQVKEAAEIAAPLSAAAERAFAPNHLGRAQVHRVCGDAMLEAGNREEAERLLTLAAAEFGATFSEAGVDRELCYDGLLRLYSTWPGHAERFREASVQALASRLQHVPAARFFAMRRFLADLEAAAEACDDPTTAAAWLERVWDRRDEWAPVDHPRRAMFYANFARLARDLDGQPHHEEAISAATGALPYAHKRGAAELVLRGARRTP